MSSSLNNEFRTHGGGREGVRVQTQMYASVFGARDGQQFGFVSVCTKWMISDKLVVFLISKSL